MTIRPELLKFLNTVSKEEADVLSALRGPDSRNWCLKNCTTAILRGKIRTFRFGDCRKEPWDCIFIPKTPAESESHFIFHVISAAEALGLKFIYVNDIVAASDYLDGVGQLQLWLKDLKNSNLERIHDLVIHTIRAARRAGLLNEEENG